MVTNQQHMHYTEGPKLQQAGTTWSQNCVFQEEPGAFLANRFLRSFMKSDADDPVTGAEGAGFFFKASTILNAWPSRTPHFLSAAILIRVASSSNTRYLIIRFMHLRSKWLAQAHS